MATDLARLVVSLEAQNTQMLTKLEQSEKRAAAWQRKVSKSVSSVSNAFKGLLIGGAGVAGFQAIVKASAESEKAITQLETALKSTGGSVGFTSQQIQAAAADLQRSTTFDDESIIDLQTRLLSFGNITGEVFERTTQAALDMSARLGKDLPASALQLGKALNDPIKGLAGLSRAGVQFSKDQREVIQALAESGRLSEAQGIILDELEKKFGGAAEAARNTMGGAMQALHNAFSNLLESPGGMKDATAALNEFTAILEDPQTKQAAESLTGAVITSFRVVTETITGAINGVREFSEWLAKLNSGPALDSLAEVEAALSEVDGKINALSFGRTNDERQAELDSLYAEAEKLRNLRGLYQDLAKTPAPQIAAPAAPVIASGGAASTGGASGPALKSTGPVKAMMAEADAMYKQLENQMADRADALASVENIKINLLTDEQYAVKLLQAQYTELQNAVAKGAISQEEAAGISGQLAEKWAADMESQSQAELERLTSGLLSQEEEIAASYERRRNEIVKALDQTAADQVDRQTQLNELLARLETQHGEVLAQADRDRMNERLSQASYYTGALASLMQSGNSKLFAIGKAAAIAQATIDGYKAVQSALAEVPYPFNFAAAAMVGAATAVQIANIASTNFSGAYDAGGTIPAGKFGLVGEVGPELVSGPATVTGRMDTARMFDQASSQESASGGVRIVNAFDTGVIGDYLGSSAGEDLILNVVQRNGRKVRSVLG